MYPLKHHFYFVIKCCNLHLGSVEELHQIFSAFQSKVMEKEKTLREVRFLYFMYFNDRLFSFVKLQIMACRIFKIILNMSVLSLCPKHCLLTCFWIVKVEELKQDSVVKKRVNLSLAVCKSGSWFDTFILWLGFLNPTLRQNRSYKRSNKKFAI